MNRREFFTGAAAVAAAVAVPMAAAPAAPAFMGVDLGRDERLTIAFVYYGSAQRAGKSTYIRRLREYYITAGHNVVDIDAERGPMRGKSASFIILDDTPGSSGN